MASMNRVVSWKKGGEHKASAEKVQDEIDLIAKLDTNGKCSNRAFVDFAQNHPLSESHKCFEWNDTAAADGYRLYQAEKIKNSIRVDYAPIDPTVVIQREVKVPLVIQQPVHTVMNHALSDLPGDGHKNIELILSNQVDTDALKVKMYHDLRIWIESFKTRYALLPDAVPYIQELEKIKNKIP